MIYTIYGYNLNTYQQMSIVDCFQKHLNRFHLIHWEGGKVFGHSHCQFRFRRVMSYSQFVVPLVAFQSYNVQTIEIHVLRKQQRERERKGWIRSGVWGGWLQVVATQREQQEKSWI